MLGLAVLFFVGLYFLILIFGTSFAYRFFKNRSRKLAIYSGTTVFLAIFLPVFWDWIPTVIAHDYYCKQAGFTEFKPVEQWKKENPGVWETLGRYNPDEKDTVRKESGKQYMDYQGERYERYPINPRISIYGLDKRLWPLFVFTGTRLMYDEEKQEVLAINKSVRAGPGNYLPNGFSVQKYGWSGLKFWLNLSAENCESSFELGRYVDAINNPALDPDKTSK